MRGLSGVVTLAIFTMAVIASTIFLTTVVINTYEFAQDRAVKTITGLMSPVVSVNLTSCDPLTGIGVLNITLLDTTPDPITEVYVVGVNGTIRSAKIVNRKALVKYPCNEDFIIAFNTRMGAFTFYTTRNDPLHACISPPRKIVNSALLSNKCTRGEWSGSGTVRVLEAEKNAWYAIKVNDNPYCVIYNGRQQVKTYRWDLDNRYIVFQSPVNGPLYIVPCDEEEANYHNGFSTLEYIVPQSALKSQVRLSAVAAESYTGQDFFTIINYTTSVEELLVKNGGLVYRDGELKVPKQFIVINTTDLDEYLKGKTKEGYAIHYVKVEWENGVLEFVALVLVNYWNARHYPDPWRATLTYSCLYGTCNDNVLGFIVDNVLTETMGEKYNDIKSKGKVQSYPFYLMALTNSLCNSPLYLPKHIGFEWHSTYTLSHQQGKVEYRLPSPIYRTFCALERRAESRIVLVMAQPVFKPITRNPKTYNIWGAKLVVIDNIDMLPVINKPSQPPTTS